MLKEKLIVIILLLMLSTCRVDIERIKYTRIKYKSGMHDSINYQLNVDTHKMEPIYIDTIIIK